MIRTRRQATTGDPIGLVAFLGNPGRTYAATRHNVAWRVADLTAPTEAGSWKTKFHGSFCKNEGTVLLKPTTFMNHSGRSVQAALSFFGLDSTALLVVHDDLETEFGTVQFAWDGGHRGHNGIRSVTTQLACSDYWRLRIGIGRPPAARRVADWVLERFSREEEMELPAILRIAHEMARNGIAQPEETRIVREVHS